MRRYLLIPEIVALVMSLGSMATATPIVLNMDELPNVQDPSWQGDNVSASVSGGILTWAGGAYTNSDWSRHVSSAQGWVLEARMKLDPSSDDCYNAGFWINDRVCCTLMSIYKNKVRIFYPDQLEHAMDTTDTFHVYRIEGKGDTFRLSVDGALAIDYHRSWTGGGNEMLQLGCGSWSDSVSCSGDGTGRSYWDYFSYDTETPLVASFEYSPEKPRVNQEIEFDASSSHPPDQIVTYAWDFGDGSTGWAIGPFYRHTYSTYGDRIVTLTVTDKDGQTASCSKRMDSVPPKTKHTLSGENKHAINVTLTAEDEFSGVDVTKYVIWKLGGPEYGEGTQFTVDLADVQSVIYYSIDKAGNREEGREIRVTPVKEEPQELATRYMCNEWIEGTLPSYTIYVYVDYFRISFDRSEVVFVDRVSATTGPELCEVYVNGFRLCEGGPSGRTIKQKTEGFGLWPWPEWTDISVVDWTGQRNSYALYIDLVTTSPGMGLNKQSISVPTPEGLLTEDKCLPYRTVSFVVPAGRGFLQDFYDVLFPFQTKTHNVKVPGGTTQASFGVSWPGSDLDLILYDPTGREINADAASTEPSVHFVRGDTYEQYRIVRPVPGQWTMKIVAIDVPEDGEAYTAMVDLSTGMAWNPNPRDGAGGVSTNTVLTWASGSGAVSDNLYLSTDFDDVNDATNKAFKGNLLRASYSPGPLKVNQTYYWRVDEVNGNDPGSPWKGNVWKFSTTSADYDGQSGVNFKDFAHLAMRWLSGVTADVSVDAGRVRYGDVSGDGKVAEDDAALVAQYAVGLIGLTYEQIEAADVSGDGDVSAYDAALISQYAAGLIERFPVEEALPSSRSDAPGLCGEPNWCGGADLDRNGRVDFGDLLILSRSWCEEGANTPPGRLPLLVAYWELDEGTGTTASDSAGRNPGTVYGAKWVDGQIGGALRFNGVDHYVDCGKAAALAPEKMTVAFWMFMEGKTSYQYILGRANDMGLRQDYALFTGGDGRLKFAFGEKAGAMNVQSKGELSPGQWVYVVATRDGAAASLYLNGHLENSAAYSFTVTNKGQSLRIGSIGLPEPEWAGFFKGMIDDVRIYDKALSAEEIQELYKQVSP
jgi:hypothetical protein